MRIFIYGTVLFLAVVIMLLALIFICVNSKRKEEIAEEYNAMAIGANEVRIEKSEIINRFYDYQMDAFLRHTFPGLRSWNPVYEERVGFQWEGLHVVTCHMLDGNRFNVSTYVQKGQISPELYQKPLEEIDQVSYEEKASEWMSKWNSELATHATRGDGFSIPLEELPAEEEVLDLVIEHIATQGDFSTQLDDDCLRLAYSMA